MLMRYRYSFIGLLIACLSLWGATSASAQQVDYTLSGEVTDGETGGPLPGANVSIRGTRFGSISSPEGTFSFTARLVPGTYEIRYTFVGFRTETQTVTLGDEERVTLEPVEMRPDVLGIDEVVVTGTGLPTERRELGNAIATVDAQDLEDSPSISLDRALQGRVAGAQVQQNSGNPAGGISVRLRGTSTVLGDAQPLYIIDGVIINNDSPELLLLGGGAQNRLVDINPQDIERIEVVKGAAAAALYGSRANNGVIEIFTKRGQQGAPRVSFATRVQTEAVRRTLDVNMARNDDGQFIDNAGNVLPADEGRFDFQDFIFQRAWGTEQNLSVSGGSETTTYALSGAHFVNQGIVDGNDFRRLNARVRVEQQLTDWAVLSSSASFAQSTTADIPNGGLNSNYGALTGFIFGPNTFDPRPNELGQFPDEGILANPLEVQRRYDFDQSTNRFIGSAQLDLTPTDNLSINYVLGLDQSDQEATAFIPRGTSAPGLGEGFSRRAERSVLQVNNNLNVQYETALSSRIASTTLLGGTLQYDETDVFSAESQTLSPVSQVVQSGTTSRVFGETRAERAIAGVFIQQKLGVVDRLFLTGALRMDASSVFGVDERLQFYPKASAAYVVSDEAFWQNSSLGRTVGHFKLRSSIGWSGGLTAIGPFDRFTNFSPQSYIGQPGLQPSAQLGALNVRPERQREIEVGVDAGLFDRRLSIEATYYTQNTTDLLLNRSVAPTTGFLNRLQNIGTLRNDGFELMVTAVPLNQERLRWTSSFIFNTNSNEVSGIEEDVLIFPNSFGLTGAVNGESIGVFFGSAFERDESGNVLDQNGNILDRDSDGLYRLRTGAPQEAGDGVPARAAENQIIGDPTPDFTASWTNEFVIAKNLRLRAQIDAVYGQDVFNFTRRLAALFVFGTLEDYERELEGDLPSGYTGTTFNIFEHWVEDGSFIKLRELSLSYTLFPTQLPVESIRLNLAARNLFSIDSYSGYDPEVNVGGQRTTTRNFDFVEVPIPRSFSLGATLNF